MLIWEDCHFYKFRALVVPGLESHAQARISALQTTASASSLEPQRGAVTGCSLTYSVQPVEEVHMTPLDEGHLLLLGKIGLCGHCQQSIRTTLETVTNSWDF